MSSEASAVALAHFANVTHKQSGVDRKGVWTADQPCLGPFMLSTDILSRSWLNTRRRVGKSLTISNLHYNVSSFIYILIWRESYSGVWSWNRGPALRPRNSTILFTTKNSLILIWHVWLHLYNVNRAQCEIWSPYPSARWKYLKEKMREENAAREVSYPKHNCILMRGFSYAVSEWEQRHSRWTDQRWDARRKSS